MNFDKIIILIFFFFWFQIGHSQSLQKDYLNGKELYKSGKYNLAMETFKRVLQQSSDKTFSPYASYFYALSAYKQGHLALARDMLLQLNGQYPNWNNRHEVNHWLSKIYFEQGETEKAIEYSKDKALQTENHHQKVHFLTKTSSIKELNKLHTNYPNDRAVGYALANALASQPLADQDRTLLLKLLDKFNFDEAEFGIGNIDATVKKPWYRVAVIMPFMFEKLTPSLRKKSNQFVYDLYEGIQLAVENFQNQDVQFDLYIYDTEKSISATREILSKEELQSMDLIIGPLYPEPSRLVSDFSYKHKINIINPLSTNPAAIGNNPYSFLYHPHYITQAQAAATYTISQQDNKVGTIFYGKSYIDSVKAYTYKSILEKESFKIAMMRKIRKDTSRQVIESLTKTESFHEDVQDDSLSKIVHKRYLIPKDSIGIIYVASDDRLLASGVISAVQIRGDHIPVIGSSKWLEYRFTDFSAYNQLGIKLVAPNYLISNDSTRQYLNSYFLEKYSTPASKYACLGYDMMTFLGKSLYDYGKYFQKEWYKTPFTKGTLTPGYSYINANDNQFVPILQFENGQMKVINLPDSD